MTGDYFGSGGFGGVRISTPILHEIVRQHITGLGVSGHTATHDFQILVAGKCFARCDIACVIGLERRGLSPSAQRYLESGAVRMTEWSNATLGWRYKAAAIGIPYLPVRYLTGPAARERAGLPSNSGPFKVISTRALLGDDAMTKRMTVESLHPGTKKEDVIQNPGFEMRFAETVCITPEPTDEELRILRKDVDPERIIIGK